MQNQQTSVDHMPQGQWKFDDEVTSCFEDMLERSIPQLNVMRKAVFDIGCEFIHSGSRIVDLGCSKGDMLAYFIRKYGQFCSYVGIDVSNSMIEAARNRFRDMQTFDTYGNASSPFVSIESVNLKNDYPGGMFTLTLSVLTMMFVPMEYRQGLIKRIYNHLEPDGAFILVEKILGDTARLDEMFVDRYLDFKRMSGYSDESIQRKRLSLEGVLVPTTERYIKDVLRNTGFSEVDCFWRWMNFSGYVAIKR